MDDPFAEDEMALTPLQLKGKKEKGKLVKEINVRFLHKVIIIHQNNVIEQLEL